MSVHSMNKRRNDINAPAFVPSGSRCVPNVIYVVIDEEGVPRYSSVLSDFCHDHINSAIQEHDIVEAGHWVVRAYLLQETKQ